MPSSYLPALGGVEELTRHLALALRAAGDEVEIWVGTANSGDPPHVEELDGFVVRRLPLPLPARRASSMARLIARLPAAATAMRSALRAFRPDLLHVQCFGPNGVYATGLALLTRVPLVVTLQGETVMDDHDIFETSSIMRAGLRTGLRVADAVTACSTFTLADADRFGLDRSKASVIFNGVDLGGADPAAEGPAAEGPACQRGQVAPGRSPVPPELGGKLSSDRYLFALGRVVEKKGFDLLIRAFAAVVPDFETDLVVAGDGRELPALVRLAEDLGIDSRVVFPGRLSREEVAQAMASAEALVVPSRLEPFGIVVLEGWRAGVAVIATSIGGPPEFVKDGETGLLVDPFDAGAFEEALRKVLSDDVLRRHLATRGRRAVEEFDWPRVASRYRACYQSVSAGSRRSGG